MALDVVHNNPLTNIHNLDKGNRFFTGMLKLGNGFVIVLVVLDAVHEILYSDFWVYIYNEK